MNRFVPWIAAGDIEPALRGLSELGSAASIRAPPPGRRFVPGRRHRSTARPRCIAARARRRADRLRPTRPPSVLRPRSRRQGKPREALETYRELQLTFREAHRLRDCRSRSAPPVAATHNPEPLTEADYDVIVDRLAGIAAFRRAVDMQDEWLEELLRTRHAAKKSNRAGFSISTRCAPTMKPAPRANTFLKSIPTALETGNVFVTLFRLDVREGRSADVEKRGRAIMGGEIAGTTLSDRQGAARLLAEYLVSIGQPTKALGVYAALYKMTLTRGGRVDVLWRMAIASLRAGNAARAVKELQQVLRLKPDSETQRAASFWLAYAQDAAGAKSAARTPVGVARAAPSVSPTTGCARSGRAAARRCRRHRR